MRIAEISVRKLFGIFDHTVPMNLGERITIIHGPNGFGKTTILRMVNSLFNGRFAELRKIPFDSFQVTFDNKMALKVIRREPRGGGAAALDISLLEGKEVVQVGSLKGVSPAQLDFPLSFIESTVPFLSRESETVWRDTRTREDLSLEDVFRSFPEYFPSPVVQKFGADSELGWLAEVRKNVKVRFIESQRLLRLGKPRNPHEDEEAVRPSVVVYSKELATRIKAKLAEYGTLSQSLDRSFPKRLVEQRSGRSSQGPSSTELPLKLHELEDRRIQLTEAGLLDKEDEKFDLSAYLEDPVLTDTVLPVYVQDTEQKLDVFTEIARKIDALKSIINARFLYKVMSIHKERGFVFRTSKGQPLSPSHLSSGEQHMLVLLYELLFTVQPNSLILIDEPEISLHVAWQLEFLSDLQKITELASIDVLIATHAPGIINDRWDVSVELKAPMEGK